MANPRQNFGKQEGKIEKRQCTYCGMNNYIVDKCYMIHGYPFNHRQQREKFSIVNQVLTQFTSTSFESTISLSFSQEECQQLFVLIHNNNQSSNSDHQPVTISRITNLASFLASIIT